MQVAYQLNGSDLDANFLNSVKAMFENRDIEIIIHDEADIDEKFCQILDLSYQNRQNVSEDELLKVLREN
jgi:hypothetical protein